jgi:D-alanine-D-alanine ligase
MKVVILHADVSAESGKDEQDVLVQADAVENALRELGHTIVRLPVTLDLQKTERDLARLKPDLVFNLVESLAGTGRFVHFAPLLLEHLSIPFTGSGSEALYMTTGKVLTKERLRYAAVATPDWAAGNGPAAPAVHFNPPYIVKPAWEDASVGLDDAAIVPDGRNLAEVYGRKTARHGCCFVESFVEGREFNISLLADAGGVEVLPPAEILFEDFPPGKPRIVGYAAKWETGSFEYRNTPRTFDFSANQSALIERMQDLSRRCWDIFRLRGYARVDFRIDRDSNPWVIEINANPCISPDAGFVAAAGRSGLSYTRMIERIIENPAFQ